MRNTFFDNLCLFYFSSSIRNIFKRTSVSHVCAENLKVFSIYQKLFESKAKVYTTLMCNDQVLYNDFIGVFYFVLDVLYEIRNIFSSGQLQPFLCWHHILCQPYFFLQLIVDLLHFVYLSTKKKSSIQV